MSALCWLTDKQMAHPQRSFPKAMASHESMIGGDLLPVFRPLIT
ncbi:hypothetical protein [Sphingomonas sp. Leaf339]|nr:hypothetical protein [Sphingomonas sp. Leaf339]